MPDVKALDRFEKILRDGLVKICRSGGFLAEEKFQISPDINEKWEKEYLQEYVGDAVHNFNFYPESTIALAGFLGMGVAHNWDLDWKAHCADRYQDYYGSRGFDDMDEHILGDVLHLREDYAAALTDNMSSLAVATLSLIRHEGVEARTAEGFYILVRAYTVLYEIGAALELHRLGYKMVKIG